MSASQWIYLHFAISGKNTFITLGKKLSLRREQQFALVVHYKRLQGVVHIELVAQGRKSIELGQTR